jgi:hypothetical protein
LITPLKTLPEEVQRCGQTEQASPCEYSGYREMHFTPSRLRLKTNTNSLISMTVDGPIDH